MFKALSWIRPRIRLIAPMFFLGVGLKVQIGEGFVPYLLAIVPEWVNELLTC